METYNNIRFDVTCAATGKSETIEVPEGPRMERDAAKLAAATAKIRKMVEPILTQSDDKIRLTKTLWEA